MMRLKDLSPYLAKLTEEPVHTFKDLERSLKEGSAHFAELEHSQQITGRPGPGGGVEADAFHTAFFLIAYGLVSTRANLAHDTWRAWHLNPVGCVMSGYGHDFQPNLVVCSLTGELLFGAAFQKLLEDYEMLSRVTRVVISTDSLKAEIHFDKNCCTVFNIKHAPINEYFSRSSTFASSMIISVSNLINSH